MSIAHIAFIDAETVPEKPYSELGLSKHNLFSDRFWWKWQKQCEEEHWDEADKELFNDFYQKETSLSAEFGKVVAISIRKWVEDEKKFYIRSITGRDESEVLAKFSEALRRAAPSYLCGHNGLEFDFPFLMRRLIVHGLPIPKLLDVAGVKPWETRLEDTMKMWSGSAWGYKCSLELLCEILGIENPKKEMDGSSIADLYYGDDKDAMTKIGKYCSDDTLACAQVYCRIKGLAKIENVEYV